MLLDQGTGCVHTAPGHGQDDYNAGIAHKLDIYSPVGPAGLFDESTGPYQGLQVFKANERIVEDLRQCGSLLHSSAITHSYPHCWRCKKPVIFRATEQWFIAMDTAELRGKALAAIKGGELDPPLGRRTDFQHDRKPSRLVHFPPARLGRAFAGVFLQIMRRTAAAGRHYRQRGKSIFRAGLQRLVSKRCSLIPAAGNHMFALRRPGI